MSSRSRVLSLYRTILRTGRSWQGPQEEREYIRQEARAVFRQHKHLASPAEIEAKLVEGRDRLDIAVHYRIPYPRMQHAPQFKRREYQDVPIIK
ncbi:complex 1 protein-domain-containing protein [Scenedesmus sp. NREL 46B-D3]|nr:complex 1 protein-domain-containing protein [Scenedesmus sp. NREL 46B-D3]